MSCAAVYVVAFSPVFIDPGWVVCTADHSATVTGLAESILYKIKMANGTHWKWTVLDEIFLNRLGALYA